MNRSEEEFALYLHSWGSTVLVKPIITNSGIGVIMPAYNRVVYHKEDLDRFIVFLKKFNGNITLASRSAGILGGRRAVMTLMKKYDWFAEAYDNAMDEMIDDVEQNMMKAGKKSLSAGRFLLKYHKKGRERGYGSREEITGKNGEPISFAQVMAEGEGHE